MSGHPNAIHRPIEPCNTYNCHGLTFAARRTWIHEPSELLKILEDDDYEEVTNGILPGDIAIYIHEGDAGLSVWRWVVWTSAGLDENAKIIAATWGVPPI